MDKWLSIVGIGEDGPEPLGPVSRALIDSAEILVGGDRHLAMLPEDGRERLTWPSPLLDLIPDLLARKPKRVCVLATGDPMQYGIGVTLAKHIPVAEMTIVPAPSAFALACARLGWDRMRCDTLTLHGRKLSLLNSFIQPGARLLLLSESGATPAQVAGVLTQWGYGGSRVTVLEHMGGEREQVVSFAANDAPDTDFADFNTIGVDCIAGDDAVFLPRVPGLPDDAFANDGQLTKREIRAATLAALGPGPGRHLWDVGAGCGSIAIEWMRSFATASAVAVENNSKRLAMIADNASALGTPGLTIVEGTAPAALPQGGAAPDAVFIGGGLTASGLFDACWDALSPGGRLVANAVTAEGERALFDWLEKLGGEMTRIAVSHLKPVGRRHGWKPLMTVTQYAVTRR